VSSTLTSYKPSPRVLDSISNYNIMSASWGLSINYENTTQPNASDSLSSFSSTQANWGLGVCYENTIRNISD
jgi:hypothetical protein